VAIFANGTYFVDAPRTYRHRRSAWITYALFMVFQTCLGRRRAAKIWKVLLFDVPDSVIRNRREMEKFTSNLFERQVKQMKLDLFFEKNNISKQTL
jgi:hypothetical protein